jgi:hypothetical protein
MATLTRFIPIPLKLSRFHHGKQNACQGEEHGKWFRKILECCAKSGQTNSAPLQFHDDNGKDFRHFLCAPK